MTTATPISTGKVRGMYDAGDDRLLIVASDRISVFDVVMNEPVPGKGKVLTAMTEFWLSSALLADIPNHMLTTDMSDLPPELAALPDLQGRGMLVHRARILPIECIVRGYLFGSVVKEYNAHGTATGIPLPPGLLSASELPEPIFTPSTKAEAGEHDQNVDLATAREILAKHGFDPALADEVARLSLEIYTRARVYARARGIIIADTKFEWGIGPNDELMLCDEVLTPDSSRFWEANTWEAGKEPTSFDKQSVRDYAAGLGWNKKYPPPPLPPEVIEATQWRYKEVLGRLTS